MESLPSEPVPSSSVEIVEVDNSFNDASASPDAAHDPTRRREILSSMEQQRLIDMANAPEMSMSEKTRDVLSDVKDIKQAQMKMSDQLEHIRKENSFLYDDVSWVRDMLGQQQVVIDKLIHFLMTMLGGRRTFLKRTYPYILEDSSAVEKRANQLKYIQWTGDDKGSIALEEPKLLHTTLASTSAANIDPVIALPFKDEERKLIETILASTVGANIDLANPEQLKNPPSKKVTISPESIPPGPLKSLLMCTLANSSPAQVKNELQELTVELQQDIDSIRDMMSSATGIGLDTETILKLFDTKHSNVPHVPKDKMVNDPRSLATVAQHGLEDKQIKQQDLVDMAAANKSPNEPADGN